LLKKKKKKRMIFGKREKVSKPTHGRERNPTPPISTEGRRSSAGGGGETAKGSSPAIEKGKKGDLYSQFDGGSGYLAWERESPMS